MDRIGRPVVGADVIEAFVKPRSRPEPNLGSRIFSQAPGNLGEIWAGSFGVLGFLGGM